VFNNVLSRREGHGGKEIDDLLDGFVGAG